MPYFITTTQNRVKRKQIRKALQDLSFFQLIIDYNPMHANDFLRKKKKIHLHKDKR